MGGLRGDRPGLDSSRSDRRDPLLHGDVKPRYPGDRAHERKHAFLRAIDGNPPIDITRGHFRADVKPRPLAESNTPTDRLFRPRLRPTWLLRSVSAVGDQLRQQSARFRVPVDPLGRAALADDLRLTVGQVEVLDIDPQ